MDGILRELPAGEWVLDLAAQQGSFPAPDYPLRVVRADLHPPAATGGVPFVRTDAARLPFVTGSFSALICNHGLEHFVALEAAVAEMGRVLAPGGALFLSVPDAGTVTDRLYRFLAAGGGHVNAFRRPREVIGLIERLTGLPVRGVRTLYTSLSFVHPANRGRRRNRRFLALPGVGERALRWATYLFRLADRRLGTRLAVYGWEFYFGEGTLPVAETPWSNVCIRCGAGHPAERLRVEPGLAPSYECPRCGTRNLFTPDVAERAAGTRRRACARRDRT